MARLTSPGHRDTRECCTIYKAAAAEHISQQEKRKRVCKNTCLDSSVKGRTIDHQQPLRCRFRSPKLSVAGAGGGVNESCCHCVTVFSAQRTTEKVLQEERTGFCLVLERRLGVRATSRTICTLALSVRRNECQCEEYGERRTTLATECSLEA